MKKQYLILTLLILIVLNHSLRQGVLTVYYFTATKNFVERLCANKARPEMKCDGKCVFAKLIKQQQSQSDPLSLDFLKPYHIPLFYKELTRIDLQVLSNTKIIGFSIPTSYSYLFIKSNFHPPEFSI